MDRESLLIVGTAVIGAEHGCGFICLTLVHAPVHASWLNQIEIYFSIVQRKVLTPNDLTDLDALAERLLDFQYYWETTARPFEWKFTRQDLAELLGKLATPR
jgi:hypothetical protein